MIVGCIVSSIFGLCRPLTMPVRTDAIWFGYATLQFEKRCDRGTRKGLFLKAAIRRRGLMKGSPLDVYLRLTTKKVHTGCNEDHVAMSMILSAFRVALVQPKQ